jgi:hypothetical protein
MIVIGLDAATERSGHAAAWAAREAAELGTALSVVDSPDVSSRPLRTLSLDAEFAVIGTRGRAGIPRELTTYCPVVFVRGAQPAAPAPELVLGLEPNEDPAPIEFAFRTAARLGLEVRAVRAFQLATAYDGCYEDDIEVGRRDALIGMGSLLVQYRLEYPEVPVSIEAYCADTVDALSAAARHAHLLVVGGRKKLGHVVRELLARGGAPVAVVPAR